MSLFYGGENISNRKIYVRLRGSKCLSKILCSRNGRETCTSIVLHKANSFLVFLFKEKVLNSQQMAVSHHYLFQLIGLGLVLIAVGILAVGHAQSPHSQDAVDVVTHPGILLLMAG